MESIRKKNSARLQWDTKPRRAVNPKDIEFQTAEIVVPNPARDQMTITSFRNGFDPNSVNKAEMNRLIWGDNILALQALLASGYEGRVNLIYIDPPFWTGEDYFATFQVGDSEITKTPSVIERLAYKDTWEGGIDSFLDMMYPRLQLMKRLLAETGSIYVHLDWHVGHYVKVIMDEIFGKENFINEIIWKRRTGTASSNNGYGVQTDSIYFYSKSDSFFFTPQFTKDVSKEEIEEKFNLVNPDGRRYWSGDLGNPAGLTACLPRSR